jgi:YebC/PmpR family DNA-binding regulatory protein
MSGHSKWKKIKRQKGVADLKKGNLFTKLGQAITIAVREGGGGEPDMNFMLRIAIEKAREANMPNNTVRRAIDKGLGKGDSGPLENITYDIVGKGGIAILVDCLTDNKNRTIGYIRKIVTKTGFSMGSGSMNWQFEEKGRVVIEPFKRVITKIKGKDEISFEKADREKVTLNLIDLEGVEDVLEDGEVITILTSKKNFSNIYKKIAKMNLKILKAEMAKIPKNRIELESDIFEKIQKLLVTLEENPDIITVWTNVK